MSNDDVLPPLQPPSVIDEPVVPSGANATESGSMDVYTTVPVKYWWPTVDSAITPFVGRRFKTLAEANVGGSKSFRLCKEAAGSFADVGATDMEFHNFKRDLQQYVDDKDGEMIIAKYSLVFVPFTVVDNHKRCITFGAAMINREDTESYVSVLDRFKDAMGQSPMCVVTDQDPDMKVAIARVLPETRHRYCMWHIMTKVSEKLGGILAQNETFRNKLNNIVWDETIAIGEFEAQWHSLMEEHNLTGHRWFTKLYVEREFWIPAYFLDLPMSGLLCTTSRSEAANNVYGKSTRPHCSLVEFYMQYDSVLETQRHTQDKLNAESEGSLPEFKTPLAIKRHTAQVFTIRIFYELQKEIESACFYCGVVGIHKDNGVIRYDIKGSCSVTHTVEYNPTGVSASCICKLFERLGMVCEHMFSVFRAAQLESLPPDCIAPCWWSKTMRQTRMLQVIQDLRDEFLCDGMGDDPAKGNRLAIATLCGVQPPASKTIKPPAQAKNKGTAKRIKNQRELAKERSVKAVKPHMLLPFEI
ncbi:PREDICTED: protein FAR1-RELATED SEQUENCE 5-like [Ipomoea nil]|uniref:protein FAR1-RELATED SEQUENCE 5-like n=1 Tax=Ipomoea nil TaxID=35883 RepID=UPI0009017DAE|nr:PREDICTED: protein FAR1-RELATED SEQUENCE 5-like [Ipomoea nil]